MTEDHVLYETPYAAGPQVIYNSGKVRIVLSPLKRGHGQRVVTVESTYAYDAMGNQAWGCVSTGVLDLRDGTYHRDLAQRLAPHDQLHDALEAFVADHLEPYRTLM